MTRFYQSFELRDRQWMLCFQMETACFELFQGPTTVWTYYVTKAVSYSYRVQWDTFWWALLWYTSVTLWKNKNGLYFWHAGWIQYRLHAASLFQIFMYIFYKRSEKWGWEWMWYKPYSKESIRYNGVTIPEAPDTFRIEILYNEVGSHFNLIVPLNAHNILSPPQLPGLHTTLSLDLSNCSALTRILTLLWLCFCISCVVWTMVVIW